MINNENIGKRLKQVRDIFKFTQRRMAEMLRVQESTYKKNEKGLHRLNINTLDQLHDELGVSAEWLLF
ncbi:MAG: Helix-turn-helix domain, partial [Acidobacteriota bacterium]|nr:Helix-turn-helix domain [Acidobacteriota bacterium]